MCVCEYSINFLLGYFRLFIIFVGQFVNGIRAIYKFFSKYKRTFQARILEGLFCFMELVHAPISSSDIVAVYKITFDNKWFYIGSSSNLQSRVYAWATMLRDINRIKYKIKIKREG